MEVTIEEGCKPIQVTLSPFFSWGLKWRIASPLNLDSAQFSSLASSEPPDLRLYMFIINEIYLQLGEEIDGMSYLGSKAIWLDCSVKLFFFVTVWQVGSWFKRSDHG